MPKLKIVARNVTKAPSLFIIRAFDKRLEDISIVTPDAVTQAFVTEVISPEPVEPGVLWTTESPNSIDHDMTKFFWYVPTEYKGRFYIESFKWGDKDILFKAGLV